MTESHGTQATAQCCADFYESPWIEHLLGEVYHPGGLALTRHLGERLALQPGDRVLDLACGRGASALYLAATFGCQVTGLDYGIGNLAVARAQAAEEGLDGQVRFCRGGAGRLPFAAGAFDAIITECSFCTFAVKAEAVAEMARVLRPGGRLGLADVTVQGELPAEAQTLLAWVACVAGAASPEEYVALLFRHGFGALAVEDDAGALLDMIQGIRRNLMGLALAVRLGKAPFDPADVAEAQRQTRRAANLTDAGVLGYALITGVRENREPRAVPGAAIPKRGGV